jgi:hypothetical protein
MKNRTSHVFRRLTAWQGVWPVFDRSGLWLQVRWLWWTFDYFPQPVADSLGRQVDDLRRGF